MQVLVSVEKSCGQLLYDLGFKHLCDGKHSYSAKDLDSRILEGHLIKEQSLNFPIYAKKNDEKGRNFLTNPGVFIPPNLYYFFKEARYLPDKKTFAVIVNIVKNFAEEISPGRGYEKEMLVEEIRSSISDLSFERLHRVIGSAISGSYTIFR